MTGVKIVMPVTQDEDAAAPVGEALHMFDKTVQVSGDFNATYQMQISLNGEDWQDEGDPITEPVVFEISKTGQLRVFNVAYTDGEAVVTLTGHR